MRARFFACRLSMGILTGAVIAGTAASLPLHPRHSDDRHAGLHPFALAMREGNSVDDSGFDVTHATIDLTVESIGDGEGFISGTVVTEFEATASIAAIVLDLHDDFSVSVVTGEDGVTVSEWSHDGDELRVVFPSPVSPGTTGAVRVSYAGTPPRIAGPISDPPFVFGTRDGSPYAFTLSVPYRSWGWWPCKETLTDKFTVALSCTVPNPLTAASNGVLQSTTAMGPDATRFEWRHDFPIAPYLVSLAIAEYTLVTDTATFDHGGETVSVPLEYWIYPDLVADAAIDFERVPLMLESFSEHFGVYPFAGEKLGYALVEWGGGMEHQTCVSLGSRFINGNKSGEWAIAHELAHQWFGDWLTVADWQDVWLNEGFATYCEALWQETLGGRDAYLAEMTDFDFFPPPDFGGFDGEIFDPTPLYGLTPYKKGAWVLHMLRNEIGDEAFFATMSEYVSERGNGNTSTSAFQAVAERVGRRDLQAFFQQWIHTPGRPDYRFSWGTASEAGGLVVRARVKQAQVHLNAYRHLIPLAIVSGSDTTWVKVDSSRRDETFTIPVSTAPSAVLFDPEGWILRNTMAPAPAARLGLLGPAQSPTSGPVAIRYTLDGAATVTLTVYDVAGRRVRVLVDGETQTGAHAPMWDGRDGAGNRLGAGTYFLELRAGGDQFTSKVVRAAR